MKWLILGLGIATNASASILIKMAISPPRTFPTFSAPLEALSNWPFWLGLGLYGSTFLIYNEAQTKLPLNIVHPVLTSGAIATVVLLSVVIFRETFYWTSALGIILIIAGVLLITSRFE